jgi:hypothetical protein
MLLTSRYSVSFILLILFLFKAGPSLGQPLLLNRIVSITVTDMPLNSVLQKLGKETGIRFSYDPDLISSKHRVTIKAVNQPLDQVLNQIFDAGFAYREIGNQLVIFQKNDENKVKPPEISRPDQQIIPADKIRKPIPDTVTILKTDTLMIFRTDTLVKTETVIQHDTVRHTDTIYMYRTQKAGKHNLPNFDKNSVKNQKFHEHNGLYAGITYQQLFGKPAFTSSSNANSALLMDSKNAAAASGNYSAGAIVGYDFYRIGIQSGVSYTRLGENFEYSYIRQEGGYFKTDTVEKYYTLTGVDTSWYYITDSSYVNLDYKKYIYKNPNVFRYIEIPLMAKFRFFQGENLDLYATAGVIAGILSGYKALYIKPDTEKSVDWISSTHLEPFLFYWQAGLGGVYNLSDGFGILIEASFRNQLSSQYKDYPLEKKFKQVNIKTGIFVRL